MKTKAWLALLSVWAVVASAQDGTLKWRYQTGDVIFSSPAIGTDGTVYVGNGDRHLYALNPDGTLKWRYETSSYIDSSPAIGADGTVYVGCGDQYLYALNPNGTLKWRYQTGAFINASPAIGADGTVYVGSGDDYLYAINPDGSLKWRYKMGNSIYSFPAISPDGTIYVSCRDHYLYALNPDGTLKWSYQTGDDIHSSSPAIGSDGTVYVGSWDKYLYALNSEGSLKWRYQTGDWVNSSPAVGSDGTVYVGSIDRYFYALNPDGRLKWRCQTGDYVFSSPVIGSDGTVYVGGGDTYFYALNQFGNIKWRYRTGDDIQSSPVIGSDGRVYVGCNDRYLYAIETDCGGLADGPWPMHGNNPQHTGLFAAPFYHSFECIAFQTVAGDYSRDVSFYGSPIQTTIFSCQFSNPDFSLNSPLPVSFAANQTADLNYTITPNATGIYTSTCTLGWQTAEKSGELVLNLSHGLILQDNSESDVVGTQVLAAYDSSFAKDPSSIATKNNLALLYRICGDPQTADRILSGIESTALSTYYCVDVYLLNRGVTQSDLNFPDSAAVFYAGVWSNGSEALSAKAWYNAGWEAFQRDDYHEVLSCTDSVLVSSMVSDYTLAKAWCLRGAALLALGETQAAFDAFEEAESLDPDGPIGEMARYNLTGVETDSDEQVPERYELYANYPNPFNPTTSISFDIPSAGDVTLCIYDILGRLIRELQNDRMLAGSYTFEWNGLDDDGGPVGSGIYVLRMTGSDFRKSLKLTLIR